MAISARIDELQRKFGENPRRYFAPLANEYRKSGNLEQAILICQEYLPQQPGHMSGHIVYGQTLYEAGRFAEARAVFETALALDPENLIALHHLGDIARQLGDIDAARSWYRRVLETDPRSDEIIQMLAELDGAPAAVAEAGAAGISETDTPSSPVPSPVSFDVTSDVPPIPITPVSVAEEAAATELVPSAPSGDQSSDADAFELVPMETTETEVPVVAEVDESAFAAADRGAEQVADVAPSIVEPTTAEGAEAVDEAPVELGAVDRQAREEAPESRDEERRDAEPTPEEEVLLSVDLGSTVTRSEDASLLDADLFGETAALSETEQVASGVDLPVESMRPSSADIEREIDIFEAPAHVPDTNALAGEIPESRSPFTPATGDVAMQAGPPPEPEAEPRVEAAVETAPIDGGHDGQEVPAEPGEVFVTETMAELYLRQGHLEAALDIFRRLVAQRPSETGLRDRLRAVEDLLFGNTVEIEAPATTPSRSPTPTAPGASVPASAAPIRPTAGGPTIRDFLSGILTRRSSAAASAPRNENGGATKDGDTPRSEAPASAPSADGPLASMFADAGVPSESSVAAASTLAEAFAHDEPGASTLKGLPAHRAASELSLDQVFRANTPATGTDASEAFSFDRFFAEGSVEPAPPPGAEPPPGTAGSADDIEQFNAWLSGLKKA